MSSRPIDVDGTPWKAAFASTLERLRGPDYVQAGSFALRQALDQLRSSAFVQAQVEDAARAGDEAAGAMLTARKVPLGEEVVIILDDDWALRDVEDRHQRWLVQQWRFVRDGIAHWRRKGSPATLVALLSLAESWCDANACVEALQRLDQLNWHDHVTAFRAQNLLLLGCALRETDLPDEDYLPLLFKLVELHASVLTARDFYTVGTNHGFDQAYALYCLSAALPISTIQLAARPVALRRLQFEIEAAFNEEGVHVENSPTYHLTTTRRLLRAQQLLSAFERSAPETIEPIVERAMAFLTHALKPDRSLPLLGDSNATPVRIELESLAKFRGFAELHHAYSGGAEGQEPTTLDGIYPRAGYAFLRDRWPSPTTPQGLHLTLKCGFLSQYHRHDDDNTVLLFAFGEDWLIGSGIYKYHEQDSLRRYLRSAHAHNLLVIEGSPVNRSLNGPPSGIRSHTSSPTGARVVSETSMFDGFVYERSLEYDRAAARIKLLDVVRPATDRPYDATLRFHVPEDKEVVMLGPQSVRVTSPRSGVALRIEVDSPAPRGGEVCSGQHEPVAGWTSPQLGVLQRATCISFPLSARGRIAVTTRLWFESQTH